MKRSPAFGSGAAISKGGAIWVSPLTAVARPLPAPLTRLALPARTRYNTSGLERPLLWPVLACPRMAGFEVSTEAPRPSRICGARQKH